MDNVKKATHEGPLIISGIEIPAYVLEDGTRILSQRGLQQSIGLSRSGGKDGARRVGIFLTGMLNKGIEINDLNTRVDNPIMFKPLRGPLAHGYEATILADICDAVFEANKQGKLLKQQNHLAVRCEILMRGFAKVGIIALVDEATGYQEVRDRLALQKILDKYLREEFAQWAKTFPDEFYERLFKLKEWQYSPLSVKRPGVVAYWTKDLIYKRLAPGVLTALQKKNPTIKPGRRKHKLFTLLSDDYGIPALRQLLTSVVFLMSASPNWTFFYRALQRAAPKYGDTVDIDFGEPEDE
jgi:hypothetical protein